MFIERVSFATPCTFDNYRILPHTEVVDNKKVAVDKRYHSTMGNLCFIFCLVGLVVDLIVIIAVSSYSIRFSKLIGNKDPVATLATLILLSYAKILQISFESLSAGILKYRDGSNKAVWLPDAAILILLISLIY